MARSEEAGVSARVGDAVVANGPGNSHGCRHSARMGAVGHHGAEIGKIAPAPLVARHDQRWIHLAGQHVIDRWLVVVAWMAYRADKSDLVRVPGEQRHFVTYVDSGNHGMDRPEQTAHALGGIRLHVPHILLRWATPKKNIDARPGLAPRLNGRRGRLLGAKQTAERKCSQS